MAAGGENTPASETNAASGELCDSATQLLRCDKCCISGALGYR